MTWVDVVNGFIAARAYKSYLAVGQEAVGSSGLVKCSRKYGLPSILGETVTEKFDLVFIDGIHDAAECLESIEAAFSVLSAGGVVAVHDCLPGTPAMASDTRCPGAWCGDVFKAVAWYFSRAGCLCYTVDAAYGVGIVDSAYASTGGFEFPRAAMADLTYDDYVLHRDALMHVAHFSDAAELGSTVGRISLPRLAAHVPRRGVDPSPGLSGGLASSDGGAPDGERPCVTYITNGNGDDVLRMSWAARSLVKHSRAPLDIVVLSNDPVRRDAVLGGDDKTRYYNFTDMYSVLHDRTGMFRERWARPWPFEVLYRLGIPLHPGFSKCSRVLYLDTDTLVLSDEVSRLLGADIRGYEFGAVYDIDGDKFFRVDGLLDRDLRADYAKEVREYLGDACMTRAYVNGGVLLINLDELRAREDWYIRRLEMFWEAECRGKFRYLDQDFVNSMTRVRADLNTLFNWQRGGSVDNCVVQHYITWQKPDMRARAIAMGVA